MGGMVGKGGLPREEWVRQAERPERGSQRQTPGELGGGARTSSVKARMRSGNQATKSLRPNSMDATYAPLAPTVAHWRGDEEDRRPHREEGGVSWDARKQKAADHIEEICTL